MNRRKHTDRSPTTDPEQSGIIVRPDGLKYLSPARAHALLGLIKAGATLANQLDAQLEYEHGIGLRAFELLLHLAVFSEDGSLGMSQLTEQAPLSQSRVSRLVADLEARGLVERSRASSDGRGVRVSITNRGLEKFKDAQETHLSGLEDRLFSYLSENEIRQLGAITSKIIVACES